jgi:uncharacterized membrane protein YdjX (TVP38/TMEM64 family)
MEDSRFIARRLAHTGPVNNYLFGLSGIRVWPYAAATFVGVLPQTVFFVGIGASGQMILSDTSGLAFPVIAAPDSFALP